MGFALLQMQRQQVAVDPLKLSHKPRWAVLAYYALRLFEPLHFDYKAEPDHFMAYSYWRSKVSAAYWQATCSQTSWRLQLASGRAARLARVDGPCGSYCSASPRLLGRPTELMLQRLP